MFAVARGDREFGIRLEDPSVPDQKSAVLQLKFPIRPQESAMVELEFPIGAVESAILDAKSPESTEEFPMSCPRRSR